MNVDRWTNLLLILPEKFPCDLANLVTLPKKVRILGAFMEFIAENSSRELNLLNVNDCADQVQDPEVACQSLESSKDW